MTSGAHTSGNEENPVTEVISIKFRGRGKTYYFDPAGVTARTGDTLVVETSKGMELGECVKGNHMVGDGDCVQPLRPVVRRATPDDLRIAELNRKREKDELMPWSMISSGVTEQYLWREHERCYKSVTTPDCRTRCSGCGANHLLTGGGRCG